MGAECGVTDLGFAKLDLGRAARRGFAEAIYCPGKTFAHLRKIVAKMLQKEQDLLLTRLDENVFVELQKFFPSLKYNALARMGYTQAAARKKKYARSLPRGFVLVISAGTSDIAVAEEAACTLEVMGSPVRRLYDVGIAGVHRLMRHLPLIRKARVIVVVAGMDGALPTLVSGLVSTPVVAVPTSCGYGASFKGLAALLTMLNGCSPGVTVVNIDNGFGAGYFAGLINKKG